MGARMQRRAYSRVRGASTAKRPAALGYAGAGPALKPYRAPRPFTLSVIPVSHRMGGRKETGVGQA